MAKKTPHLLTVEQAATVAGLTSASITRYSTTPPPWGGCVPHVIGDNPGRGPKKVRLYPRSELERWLRQRETYFATLDAQREKKKKDRSDLRAVIARQGDELLDAQRKIIALEAALTSEAAEVETLEAALASEAAEVSRLKAQLQRKPTAPRTAPKAKADTAKARAKHRAEEAERREAEALARASEAERREAKTKRRAAERRADDNARLSEAQAEANEALARASAAERRADEIEARAKRRIIAAKRAAADAETRAKAAEARANAAEKRAAEAEAQLRAKSTQGHGQREKTTAPRPDRRGRGQLMKDQG